MACDPALLAHTHRLASGATVLIRPIRPEDEALERDFFDALSGESRRLRFMKVVRSVSDAMLHFFTHVDYERHMAFVCEAEVGGKKRLVGEARYMANADKRSCEFGVVIADEWHKTGIAGLLMNALVAAARAQGFETMEGLVLRDNREMIRFVKALGFEVSPQPEDWTLVRVVKRLRAA